MAAIANAMATMISACRRNKTIIRQSPIKTERCTARSRLLRGLRGDSGADHVSPCAFENTYYSMFA